MIHNPALRGLGTLEVLEVFEFYDKPLLLACRNLVDQLYLALLAAEDARGETWLYVPISTARYHQVRSGAIDLHDAFSLPEEGALIEAFIPADPHKEPLLRTMPALAVQASTLPAPNERLDLVTESLPRLANDLSRRAVQANREFLRLHLLFPDALRTEAPANVLGNILTSVQDTVSAIGQSLAGEATSRGQIPLEIMSRTQLAVVGVGAGSFEVDLASASFANLFGESPSGSAVEEFVSLIHTGGDSDQLKDALSRLKTRVASKYLSFLRAVEGDLQEVHAEWASPRQKLGARSQMTVEQARRAVAIIELAEIEPPVELTVRGKLIGANLRKKNYEILVHEGKARRTYAGRIAELALPTVAGAVLDREYTALLRQTNRIRAMSDDIEESYELLKLTK